MPVSERSYEAAADALTAYMSDSGDWSRATPDMARVALDASGLPAEVERLRRLVIRDHAQGHKPHADCPVCQKFGVRRNAP